MSRTVPTMRQKLDAALLALLDARGTPILREEAKGLEDGKVAALFELDHWPVAVALGGGNHASNLEWRLKAEHREKTAKRDIPAIAKTKRVRKKQEEHTDALAVKYGWGEGGEDIDIPVAMKPEFAAELRARRPKAKIRSAGFDRTKTKKFNGKVVDRGTL